jgi:transcriptional regulator GlxA family with amidase domain
LALQLLIQLVRCTSRLTAAPAKGGLSGWRLRRATEMLEGDLMRTPSIQELATAVELSRRTSARPSGNRPAIRRIGIRSCAKSIVPRH